MQVTFDKKRQAAATVYFNQSDGVLLSVLGSNRRYWGNDIKQILVVGGFQCLPRFEWRASLELFSLVPKNVNLLSFLSYTLPRSPFCCLGLALVIYDPVILLNGPLQLLNLHILLPDQDFTL